MTENQHAPKRQHDRARTHARYCRRYFGFLTLLLLSPELVWPQSQSPFAGSVPTGQATNSILELSVSDAFQRALKYNLGGIESSQNTRAAQAVRLRALNALLPNLVARITGEINQISLRSEGLTLDL